ncbi:unnamed protein product [Prunus armeniaca]
MSFSRLNFDFFLVFGPACIGERGTLLSARELTFNEIGTSLKRQLVLTAREKVGVVIRAYAVSDRLMGFIYGLVAKVLTPQEVNRDAFIKNFSSLWKAIGQAVGAILGEPIPICKENLLGHCLVNPPPLPLQQLSPSRGSSFFSPSDGLWWRVSASPTGLQEHRGCEEMANSASSPSKCRREHILAAVENLSIQVDFPERCVRQSTLLELPVEGSVVYELNLLLLIELKAQTEQPAEATTPEVQLLDIPIRKAVMQGGRGDVPMRLSCQILIRLILCLLLSNPQDSVQRLAMGLHGSDKVGYKRKQIEDISLVLQVTRVIGFCGHLDPVLSDDEKSGNKPHYESHIEDFKRDVLDFQLLSFDFVGHPFTWKNNKKNEHNVQAHLDRGFRNLQLLPQWGGDASFTSKSYGLRMTNMACFHPVNGRNLVISKVKFKFYANRLVPFKLLHRLMSISTKLDKLLELDEICWQQRSRVTWLQYGDRSISYFHKVVNHKVKTNSMHGILDAKNRLQYDYQKMTRLALNLNFKRDEVEAALQFMAPTKSLSSDGMLALFYHKDWDVVGGDVCQFCLNVLNGCDNVRGKVGRRKLVLKLDMAKAYDRIECPFFDRMMRTMEFPARFVNGLYYHSLLLNKII